MTEREYKNYIYVMEDVKNKISAFGTIMFKYDKYFVVKNRILDYGIIVKIRHYLRYLEMSGSIMEMQAYALEINDMCSKLFVNQKRIMHNLKLKAKATNSLVKKIQAKIGLLKEKSVYNDLRELFHISQEIADISRYYNTKYTSKNC